MGRSKQTSSQEYAAMLCWVEVPKNFDHIVGAATKNLKSVVAGAKVTKTSAYGEMAKHVNDMCETTGADAWTTEHARGRWTKYFSKYKTTKAKFTDNTGTKYCLTAKDRKKGINTINQKLDNDCPNFMRMDLLFGHRQNINPHSLMEPGVPNDVDVDNTDDDNNMDEVDSYSFYSIRPVDKIFFHGQDCCKNTICIFLNRAK